MPDEAGAQYAGGDEEPQKRKPKFPPFTAIILNLRRRAGGGSSSPSSLPSGLRITENNEPRITEDGDYRVIE